MATMIGMGCLIGVFCSAAGYLFAKWADSRMGSAAAGDSGVAGADGGAQWGGTSRRCPRRGWRCCRCSCRLLLIALAALCAVAGAEGARRQEHVALMIGGGAGNVAAPSLGNAGRV
jgi:hypothetical protein